jgi:chromatin structure-remodeling complex subunit RSC1/2
LNLAVSPRLLIPRIRYAYQTSQIAKLDLPQISYNDEIWKVGDWIRVSIDGDVIEPMIALVSRTWQDSQGQKWVGVLCHLVGQTVSGDEERLHDSEVVNTGKYRDYKIEQVVSRCVVGVVARGQRELAVGNDLYSSSD